VAEDEPAYTLAENTQQNNMKGNCKYALQEKNLFGFNETNDYIRQYENGPIKPS